MDNRHDDVSLERLAQVYIELIDKLSIVKDSPSRAIELDTGKKLCVVTNNGRFMNFRSNDFKKVLLMLIESSQLPKYMSTFRTLEWIVCKSGRFTNVQFIDGKSVRVITVDCDKYKLLKKMEKKK
ncbi:hypothetical protein [Sinanaerobacter sp. ZZT-01]|uniref:hypothetical protein n=1 Tax=Sinanaerobacter sp. ZZT-01 TaxID=3111540 RepID=UPI002D79CF9D|nr:hypothetical protein [Sinanaerobacter sp. ZZT-01]WRR94207.1 hypothetical protein U5921_03550 [Sinanaerobacter sp. ZZT-01]